MRMNEIRQQLGRGEYLIDPHAVADAIMRRLLAPGQMGGRLLPGADTGE